MLHPQGKKTGDIIKFAKFKGGNLLSETRDNTEMGEKSDDDSTMPPLICKEEIDAMNSGDESDDEPVST